MVEVKGLRMILKDSMAGNELADTRRQLNEESGHLVIPNRLTLTRFR